MRIVTYACEVNTVMYCVQVQVQVRILARDFADAGESSLHPRACLEGGSCDALDDVSDMRERARPVRRVGVGHSSKVIILCIASDRARRTGIWRHEGDGFS